MPKRSHGKAFSKRLAKVERELKADKPEVKTLDHLLSPLTATGVQIITTSGIYNGVTGVNYDLTRGFLQGLENTGGNIDGNYCKLTSMDLRIYLNNSISPAQAAVARIRLMLVRVPSASTLTPAEIQTQVLEYGDPATYGELCLVSPLKRNTTINGGYDVMYDRVHSLTNATGTVPTPDVPAGATTPSGVFGNPVKSTKYIHFRKKWSKGLTLRFSGVAGALALEQNRIYLFAMDSNNVSPPVGGCAISFVNRLRYSDE